MLGSLPSAGYQSGLHKSRDVRECQPGITTGESRMFQAVVVPDRYPAVPSVSCKLVRQCVRATLVQLLGYVSAVWRSPDRCAFVVVESSSFLGFEYCVVITLASREFRVLLTILPTSLRCLCIFGFVGVAWCCDPTFIAYPHSLLS